MGMFDNLDIGQLIRKDGFECDCGVHHGVDLDYIKIGNGVLRYAPEAIRALGCVKPFIVCDKNTYAAAGEKLLTILKNAGIPNTLFMLPDWGLAKAEPDERHVGAIAMGFDASCDIVIALGSGVINDLCKVFSFAANRPQLTVGTAPSMDGFASNSSSMIVNGVKTSLYNRCPSAIILDTEIMAKAPMRMLWAGLGDMVAKYISLCEWRIARIVTGEYYCEHVAELMRIALERIMAASGGLAKRDESAVAAVAEGLVLSGVAMSFAKVSRPASGLEHYFSHMWEMIALARGESSDLHGIQVGVGTVLTMRLYDEIRMLKPNREKAERMMREFDVSAWEARVKRVFGITAERVLDIERQSGKNNPEKHAARLNRIIENWGEILSIIDAELPSAEWLFGKMRETGMPMTPNDIGVCKEDVKDAFLCARDIRDKYLSTSLLWDLGELDDFAERLF